MKVFPTTQTNERLEASIAWTISTDSPKVKLGLLLKTQNWVSHLLSNLSLSLFLSLSPPTVTATTFETHNQSQNKTHNHCQNQINNLYHNKIRSTYNPKAHPKKRKRKKKKRDPRSKTMSLRWLLHFWNPQPIANHNIQPLPKSNQPPLPQQN